MRYLPTAVLCVVLVLLGRIPAADAQNRSGADTDPGSEQSAAVEVLPTDVLGAPVYKGGEWMVSYRYSNLNLDAVGSNDDGSSDHVMRPEAMRIVRHRLQMMYWITDRLTVKSVIPYQLSQIHSRVDDGTSLDGNSAGMGDFKFLAQYVVYNNRSDYVIAEVGASLPTGSIDMSRRMADGSRQRLPYPMQPGAGTFGYSGEITFIDQRSDWAWGSNLRVNHWTGENEHSYRRGNEYFLGAWVTKRLTGWMAPAVRLDLHRAEEFIGADSGMGSSLSPAPTFARQGAFHVTLQPGLSFYGPSGALEGQRVALEAPIVIHDSRTSSVLAHDWQVLLTWQWAL